MPNLDLAEDEFAAVVAAVRKAINDDRYPMSPRLKPLKAALAKLDPASMPKPVVQSKPLPNATRVRGTGRGR